MRLTVAIVFIFTSFSYLDCRKSILNSRLNFFDIDLLRYAAEDKKGNVMVSPASIKCTLAMLLEGAHGATAAEIRSALRLSSMKEDIREELRLYMRALEENTSNVVLDKANGLFVSKKLQLKKDYEMTVKRVYYSDVNTLDFGDPKTATDAINGWVKEKTRGLIPSIVEQVHINPETELLLTNALYFKSNWLNKFEPPLTHGDCFYKDGICKTVAMMELQAELKYAYVENLRAHALELPYQSKRYSMILLVPLDRDTEVALIRDLPYIGLPQIFELMELTDVSLTMPKFTVEYSEDMVAALKNMRINTLFSKAANLSGIIEGTSGYLSSIFHSVHMSVDEEGTVAAAASASVIVPLIYNEVQLRVDRPFLFFIRDNELGLVLFEGKIEEPTEFAAGNKKDLNQSKTSPRQPVSTGSQLNPSRPIPSQQIPPVLPIQPVVSHPNWNQPIPIPAISSQPIPEQPTTSPSSRKSGSSWYKRISGYFG